MNENEAISNLKAIDLENISNQMVFTIEEISLTEIELNALGINLLKWNAAITQDIPEMADRLCKQYNTYALNLLAREDFQEHKDKYLEYTLKALKYLKLKQFSEDYLTSQ